MIRYIRYSYLLLCFFLISCGTFQKNPQLTQYESEQGYRFNNLKKGNHNTDEIFVVLSFSGGGTRAAALSYGVLEELHNTPITWNGQAKTLLDEVDIISSVSGGSFTSAFYILNRNTMFDGSFEEVFLNKDIEAALLTKALSPPSWLKLAGGSFGRSDLAAGYYNSNIFNDATFQTIVEQKMRPFLMVNATDMTTGRQFPFIQDQFDLLCADLNGVKIGRAVAASSAFPGLLTPLTYKNYMDMKEVKKGKNTYYGACNYKEPRWIELAIKGRQYAPERANIAQDRRSYYKKEPWESERKFIHLVDGGVADNIGLRNIIFALETSDPTFDIQRKINNKQIKKLLVIAVNAATDPEPSRDDSADVPGVIDVLTTAATVPLDNFTFDTLKRTDDAVSEYTKDVKIRKECNTILRRQCPEASLAGELYELQLYIINVSFDGIKDPETRFDYKNLPTTFSLPEQTVKDLKSMGKKLLINNNEFKKFMNTMQ